MTGVSVRRDVPDRRKRGGRQAVAFRAPGTSARTGMDREARRPASPSVQTRTAGRLPVPAHAETRNRITSKSFLTVNRCFHFAVRS